MTRKLDKEAVRIVCPHCRRSYVIKVDLKRIYNTKPRAVCSRCGGRFEVVQRMYEIDESLTKSKMPQPPQEQKESRAPKAPMEPKRDSRPKPHEQRPTIPTTQRSKRREPLPEKIVEVNDVTRQAAKLASNMPMPRARVEQPMRAVALPGPDVDQEAKETAAKAMQATAASLASTPPEPLWQKSTVPPAPELAPLWDSLETGDDSVDVIAPQLVDLDSPMPWIREVSDSLDNISVTVPQSAETLVWLLTERQSRPQGAGPPPVPPDASKKQSTTPPPADLETAGDENEALAHE